MITEEFKELHRETCELLQDIRDCIMSVENFDELYYIRDGNDRFTLYELKEAHVDDGAHYVYRIKCNIQMNEYIFTITTGGGNMVYKVNEELETVDQTFQQFYTGDILTFEGGLRMNEEDIDLLTDVLEWCEKYNPDYW